MCVGVTSLAGSFIQKIGQKQIIWDYKGRLISPLSPLFITWCSSSLLPPHVICSFSLVRRRSQRCIYSKGIRLAALQWCWKQPQWAPFQLRLSALIDFHGWQHLKSFQIVISHWARCGGGIFIIIINSRNSIIWILMQIEIMGTDWHEQLVSCWQGIISSRLALQNVASSWSFQGKWKFTINFHRFYCFCQCCLIIGILEFGFSCGTIHWFL